MSLNFTPKNIIKGKQRGSNFTLEEWDFNTFANLHLGEFLILFVIGVIASSILAPLVALFCIIRLDTNIKWLQIIGVLIGSYFIYDASHGWLGITALNLILDESSINYLVMINFASAMMCGIMFLFNGLIWSNLQKPPYVYNSDAISLMSDKDKDDNEHLLHKRSLTTYVILFVIFFITFIIGGVFIGDKGWVEKNVQRVDERRSEQFKQDSINDLCGFSSQAEKDAHFNKLQQEWGN